MLKYRRAIQGISLLLVVLLIPETSYSQAVTPEQIVAAAGSTLAKYTPLTFLVSGLINQAVQQANSDAEDRLRQLDGIIQSAIFNLNEAMKERLQDLDEKLREQRLEAIRELDRMSVNISNLLQGSVQEIFDRLSGTVDKVANSFGNIVASLPIPVKPLVNVGDTGLSVIARDNGPTRLFITGSGLIKNGTPDAWLHGENDRNGTRLQVKESSMGLLSIVIPSSIFSDSTTPQHFTLSLGFGKGQWPSFPVSVCGALRRYTLQASIVASDGKGWEKTVSKMQWFYIDSKNFVIRPELLVPANTDWQIDRERAGFTNGLNIQWNPPTSPGGNGDHGEGWMANNEGYGLYVGNGGGNSHANATAALKRPTPIDTCGESSLVTYKLDYGEDNGFDIKRNEAFGQCDPSLKTPNIVAKVNLFAGSKRVNRSPISVPLPSRNYRALGGLLYISVDMNGHVNVTLKATCTETGGGYRVAEE